MTNECPSGFRLDAFRLGLDRTLSDHVKGCSQCTAWLAAQQQLEAEVAHFWVPAERPSWRPTRSLLRYLLGLGLPVAAGAAMLLFLVKPRHPTELAKGGPALVQIARLSEGMLTWLSPTTHLKSNDALRFFIHRNDVDDRHVLVGSVDGSQQLARFYPADASGCSVPLPPVGEAMEGSIVIDDAPGPERIVVLVSHRPLCWAAVGDLVKRFALGEPLAGDLVTDGVHATRLAFPKQVEAAR
jgi:hypothetical protein